ncbi:MAG TPA: AraC family transcriptional regulator [Cytophagales bacterium]|nr:AraC family transcriptional regulator [Cytophagales bacterium]HAA23804.1 AraC family transcriptional regulator [Cytophagales bacterium]HAP63022.1 AraC family transcriptional regulator [Cytophagales bacterium]
MQESSFQLIGIQLPEKTINTHGQSNIDCGNLWQQFEKEKVFDQIPNKLSQEVLAVYHDYDGDHTQPFAYFIGAKVQPGTAAPEGLVSLQIPAQQYQKVTVQGKMPDCVSSAWQDIWASNIARSYGADYEVYDERSHDWAKAEVDIYLSVNS